MWRSLRFRAGSCSRWQTTNQLHSVVRDTVVGEGGSTITDTMDLGASFNDWPEARITRTSAQLSWLSEIWTRTLHKRLGIQCNSVRSDLDRSLMIPRGVTPDALIPRESGRHSLVQSRRSRHAPSNPRGQGLALDILAHCLGIFANLASKLAIAEGTCGCLVAFG